MDDCSTCPGADGPSRRSILKQTEEIIDGEKWLNNWARSMCEMAGDCPDDEAGDCQNCMERMADRVNSSPRSTVASAPASRVASATSSIASLFQS